MYTFILQSEKARKDGLLRMVEMELNGIEPSASRVRF